jgi:hypothetical protein
VGLPPRCFTVRHAYLCLCAICTTRLRRRPPASTCTGETRLAMAAFNGEGSRRRFIFSRSRCQARHLLFSCAAALGRSEAEQVTTAPCPHNRCRPVPPWSRAGRPYCAGHFHLRSHSKPGRRWATRAEVRRARSTAVATGHLHAVGRPEHLLTSGLPQIEP